ncbi:hypothetical protein [Aeromicrobium sp. P5_D10]
MAERKYLLSLDERIRFARLSVKAARLAEEDADEDMLELAAMALPWEDEVPAQYAR